MGMGMDLSIINPKVSGNKEEIYTMISDIFVAEEDMKPIHDFCKFNNARVTFCDTGPEIIQQLKRGAGAKPHDVLEKSVKEARLTDADKVALKNIVGEEKFPLLMWTCRTLEQW